MGKSKLSLDELTVESFSTSEDETGRGTVAGHQVSEPYVCYTDEFCGCNDGISNRSCRATCYNGSGCGNPQTNQYTCRPDTTCDTPNTCDGYCTAYMQWCA